jgi:hypothetical protein
MVVGRMGMLMGGPVNLVLVDDEEEEKKKTTAKTEGMKSECFHSYISCPHSLTHITHTHTPFFCFVSFEYLLLA